MSYLAALFDSLRQRNDIQGKAKLLPGLNVVHVSSVQTVELMNHGILEVFMRNLSLLIICFPFEEVAHSVELPHDWR